MDRDGTLNEDPGYLNDPSQLKLFDRVPEALSMLKKHGFELFVITNQSGIGRGIVDREKLKAIHQRLNNELLSSGSKILDFGICPHHPDEACACRKPKTKLIEELSYRWSIDLSQSFMVGDKETDIRLGRNAKLKGVCLVRTGWGAKSEEKLNPGEVDFVGNSLLDVVKWILSQETASF